MPIGQKGVVLVVDDVESEIDILVDILHHDYEVCVAMDGESALQAAHELSPDLILLDVLMPGMDGYQVCDRLKKNPKTREIPIIFVTVLGAEGHEAAGLSLGALDYITKPFNRDIVLARVRNHMELIEAHRLKEDVNRIVNHDMRNELLIIIGYPDLLLASENLTESQRGMIQKIRNSGYVLLNMVNLDLQLYQMEQGRYQFMPTSVDVMKVLSRIIEFRENLRRKNSITITITLAGKSPENGQQFLVRGEELLLHAMLSNLVLNAMEASPPGGTISIDLAKGEVASIVIRNMGTVPSDIRERFFQKYVTSGKSSGTGLGAYSARLMAKAHGGTIEMSTSETDGTAVSVHLPV